MGLFSLSDIVVLAFLCAFINHLVKTTPEPPSTMTSKKRQDPTSKCFRVMDVPSTWNEEDLLDSFRSIDNSWNGECHVSLFPSCRSNDQTGLLNMKGNSFPACFLGIRPGVTKHILVTKKNSTEKVTLSVDIDFFDLTPLNNPGPKEKIIAESVIAMISCLFVQVLIL